ncbi:ComEC/Rec2 family competence protein [Kitasatospora sp. NPDC051170]|uniref:ComEC/Rec2 family competence protein n=1 Tax=Kitasatospora sp. NPDC051170 TaxID=3364056 RepID=UPI00379CCC06
MLHDRRVGAVEGTTLDDPPGEAARVAAWAAGAGVPLLRAGRGERRSAGAALSWDVLWPDPGSLLEAPGANNASIALAVTLAGGLRIALLGDLEPDAQSALIGRVGRVDVLKVAHHGSAHQDWDLTRTLHPRLALISCGEDNTYGHPSTRTLDHLHTLGATVLRTDRAGDIALTGDSPPTLAASTHPHTPTHKPRPHTTPTRAHQAAPITLAALENPLTPTTLTTWAIPTTPASLTTLASPTTSGTLGTLAVSGTPGTLPAPGTRMAPATGTTPPQGPHLARAPPS